MLISKDWVDYELIDANNGEKLERWGKIILRRPDPLAIWKNIRNDDLWKTAHAIYYRNAKGGGAWEFARTIPNRWTISYKNLSFFVEPSGFKHTGLFPEQATNWDWMINKIKIDKIKNPDRKISVLNLFAYTGAATVACLSAGADVCHVDAVKSMVLRAKDNVILNELQKSRVRFITDDVKKFVLREIKRKRSFDAIIMDPPSYGRGPQGELWKIEDELYGLIEFCLELLTPNPLFFLINSYTTGLSPATINNLLEMLLIKKVGGRIDCSEIGLPITSNGLSFPCGISGRWEV